MIIIWRPSGGSTALDDENALGNRGFTQFSATNCPKDGKNAPKFYIRITLDASRLIFKLVFKNH